MILTLRNMHSDKQEELCAQMYCDWGRILARLIRNGVLVAWQWHLN